MDTTVALFFSLGIVMSPSEQPINTAKHSTANTPVAAHVTKATHKTLKRHEFVKKRIAVTNAWLASQSQQRRQLAQIHRPKKIIVSQDISSCTADWKYT